MGQLCVHCFLQHMPNWLWFFFEMKFYGIYNIDLLGTWNSFLGKCQTTLDKTKIEPRKLLGTLQSNLLCGLVTQKCHFITSLLKETMKRYGWKPSFTQLTHAGAFLFHPITYASVTETCVLHEPEEFVQLWKINFKTKNTYWN